MLEKREQQANEFGLNDEIIKHLYANLVQHFIEEALKYVNNLAK
ncbi:hypothetical protein [Gilliamella sp. CG22]